MSDGIVIDADEAMVVARLTQKPFEYRVKIGHFAANGRWMSGFAIEDIGEMDAHNRASVAADLRWVAEQLESNVLMVEQPRDLGQKAVQAPRFQVIDGGKPDVS